MDNVFIKILDLFNPTIIYAQLDAAIMIYSLNLVPAVIILSIVTRLFEIQVENLGQGAKISEAIKDVKISIIFTVLYAGFGALVIKFHQVLCAAMYDHGSLNDLLTGYKTFIETAKGTQTDTSLEKIGKFIDSYSVETILSRAIHFLSMLLLATVTVLLRIVYALGFCMLYLWGMVAVPTMASKLLNVASGWFRGCMALFLWPLIESGIYMLTAPLFAQLSEGIAQDSMALPSEKIFTLGLIYSFANILLMCLGVIAFFLAVVISMNQNMLSGIGTSMMTAWAAGTSLVLSAAKLISPGAIGGKGFGQAALSSVANSGGQNNAGGTPPVSVNGLGGAENGSSGASVEPSASFNSVGQSVNASGPGAGPSPTPSQSGNVGGGGASGAGLGNVSSNSNPNTSVAAETQSGNPSANGPNPKQTGGQPTTQNDNTASSKTSGVQTSSPGLNKLKGP